jgi:hypothetical protein
MKKLTILTAFAAAVFASSAIAGTFAPQQPSLNAQQKAHLHALYDHPKTEVVPNGDVKIAVTTDAVMHSCCMPPNLVVAGKVTNVSNRDINYVHLIFSFEDSKGKVLHTESLYNNKAASLNDDAEVQKILGEKPHFTTLKPGDSDTFNFSIPYPMLPEFSKVELISTDEPQLAAR